jgi:phosphoribosylanthranilate isomerase
VQIAGVHDLPEARLIEECGVDLIGLPLRLPVNAEDLSEKEAKELIPSLRRPAVLITYLNRASELITFGEQLGTEWLQIHSDIDPKELYLLRQTKPHWRIFKSLVIRENRNLDALLQEATTLSDHVDAFITDTFDARTGATGATGLTHDWSISRRLAEELSRPLILAGGLNPENVAEAIHAVNPAGVDAHTGVEGADGRKDPKMLRRFMSEARRAWAMR